MTFEIKDGTGTGNKVKVDANFRAHVDAIERTEEEAATNRGDAYNVNSGLVTITSVDEQGLLYIKNNDERDFRITSIIVILGPSTSGSATDTTRVRIYKNPTTGTLISEATAADTNSNDNFGSSNTFTADTYKGDASATVTDGSVHIESLISPGNRVPFLINMTLTPGDSAAVTVEANDSNTSMKCMAAFVGHLADPNA